MDNSRKNAVKIALRFTIYLIYLASKIKLSNIYHRIRQQLSSLDYQQLHDYEKYYKIKLKADLDIKFLETCWNNKLKPKFLRFKTCITNFTNSKIYHITQRKALLFEIRSKSSKIRKFKRVLPINKLYIRNQFQSIDQIELYNEWQINFRKRMNHFQKSVENRHRKKLLDLGFYENKSNRNVFNFSSYSLSETAHSLLNRGPSFIPKPKMNNRQILNHKMEAELFFDRISNKSIMDGVHKQLASNLKTSTESFIRKYKGTIDHNLNHEEEQSLSDLKLRDSIIITKSDKVSKFVILDKRDYIISADIFITSAKYDKSDSENNFKCYKALNYQIGKLKQTLPESILSNMKPDGNRMPLLYFLPKIHKPNPFQNLKVRPIVSFYKSYSYNCAKVLGREIESILENKYRIINSFNFVNQIINLNLIGDIQMGSFDVQNLYPTIPVKEVIPKISEILSRRFNIDNKTMVKILELCLTKPTFQFYDKCYKQSTGVAMGSPLSPAVSEFFLQNLETSLE